MQEVAANPEDFATLPWVKGCEKCDGLRTNPMPGLWTWVEATGLHFLRAHEIALVSAGKDAE